MHEASGPFFKSPPQLIVRCFAEKKGDQWQAFSVEFGLAAQADSLAEVEVKLESMITCYLEDALVGEDRAFARQLLSRKAGISIFLRYHLYSLMSKIGFNDDDRSRRVFDEPMALVPVGIL